jgi:20S proteasome subunit beta 1
MEYGLREGEVSTGTTIVAVTFAGGVVLGADSRTSTGSYVANRVSDKVVPIHDYVWACRSGSAADTQAVTDYVKYYINAHCTELGRLPRVKTCANLMRKICYNNKDRMLAGMICGGWDPYEGGQVYEVPLGGTLMKQKFAIGGSGSTFIYGLVDSLYREDMTREECISFVKKVISHAMARDGSSGGVIRMVIIDESGVTKEVVLGDQLPYLP